MSQFIQDKTSPFDLSKLIEELNSQIYEDTNLLVKIDKTFINNNSTTEFHFTKTIK